MLTQFEAEHDDTDDDNQQVDIMQPEDPYGGPLGQDPYDKKKGWKYDYIYNFGFKYILVDSVHYFCIFFSVFYYYYLQNNIHSIYV